MVLSTLMISAAVNTTLKAAHRWSLFAPDGASAAETVRLTGPPNDRCRSKRCHTFSDVESSARARPLRRLAAASHFWRTLAVEGELTPA